MLVTPTSSLAHLVAERRYGIVFEPSIESFVAAIREMMACYDELQARCQATVEACFSREVFIEKYRLLYEELLQGSQVRAMRPEPVAERGAAGVVACS